MIAVPHPLSIRRRRRWLDALESRAEGGDIAAIESLVRLAMQAEAGRAALMMCGVLLGSPRPAEEDADG